MINKLPGRPLPGTLDLLILKAISLDRLHGHGVRVRMQQIASDTFTVKPGSLHPALKRLEDQRLIESQWGRSPSRRRAKYYRLTPAGRQGLKDEAARWERFAKVMTTALAATEPSAARASRRPVLKGAVRNDFDVDTGT